MPLTLRKPLLALLVLAVGLSAGCRRDEVVPEPYVPTDAHDAYRHSLAEAGLADAALGRDWLRAATAALESPVAVDPPYRETGYFEPAAAEAVGYRFEVLRGQRVEVAVEMAAEEPTRVFLDAFRVRPDAGAGEEPLLPVASAPEDERRLYFEARRDAAYVVRLQPELLRGGRYELTILADASLEFPVEGLDTGAIQSVFGAPREAGRRRHHGVDIFADRNTPVLAAADALVRRVDETPVGGRVVWLYDRERSLHLYYAHLESQEVEEGEDVTAGTIVGRVGNSGNARTTPPHLHFGIYARGEGPQDPDPFLRRPRRDPPAVRAPVEPLGRWLRTAVGSATLRARPSVRAAAEAELDRHTPLRPVAATGDFYRVALPDGTAGYIAAAQLEEPGDPVGDAIVDAGAAILRRPDPAADVVDVLATETAVPRLGSYAGYHWIRGPDGRAGWVRP